MVIGGILLYLSIGDKRIIGIMVFGRLRRCCGMRRAGSVPADGDRRMGNVVITLRKDAWLYVYLAVMKGDSNGTFDCL